MLPPPRRRHRPSLSPLVIAPLVVVGVAGALIIAVVVAGPSTTRNRVRPSDAALVTPLTVSSIVSAATAVPTIAPSPTTTAEVQSTTTVPTATTVATIPPTTEPMIAVAARPSGQGMLANGAVTVPAVDLHDRYVVAAFDAAPSTDSSWTFTDDSGLERPAHLVGYIAAVRVAVLSVDAGDIDQPAGETELPLAPWADEAPTVGAAISIGDRDGVLVAIGNEPTADGLALEHALVADTNTDSDQPDSVSASSVTSSTASTVAAPESTDPSVGDLVWSNGKILGLVVHVGDGQVLAIPSNLVKAAAASVIAAGSAELAWLGVSVTSNEHADIVVSAVNSSSPASSIGLRVGDVVTALNGRDITSPADLVAAVWSCGAGHAVEITVTRDGVATTLVGELAAMPVNA